jgi:N-dimethylarginine dimethylaminohydrolase
MGKIETSPFFLMCRPTYYRIAYEINPWMHLRRQADHPLAQRQWRTLYQLLVGRLGVRVQLITPRPGVPDLVFTANAGLAIDHTLIRSNFRYPERQREEPFVERYFRAKGWSVVTLPRKHNFEGEGDTLWMNRTLLFGFRFRSDAMVHERLAELVGARVLPVELADRRFYHLDTCFAPLSDRVALWYPKAFDRYGRKVIESVAQELIAVEASDAARFACNAIAVGRAVVMQAGCSKALARRLDREGFQMMPVDLSEFLKAGGSAKCLVLKMGDVSHFQN